MEQKINTYFASRTMPDECAHRIEARLTAPAKLSRPIGWVRTAAAAATVALVLLLCFFQRATTAFADFYDFIIHTQSPAVTQPLGRVDENTIVSYGGLVTHDPEDGASSGTFTPGLREPVTVEDGRLYFIANGEHIDITDLCSEEKAYVYVLQDNTGIRHYFAVGGNPEDYGYEIYIQDPSKEYGGWSGGASAGHRTAASDWKLRPWVYDAKEQIGHPWPLVD